jgi:hypothetical protein
LSAGGSEAAGVTGGGGGGFADSEPLELDAESSSRGGGGLKGGGGGRFGPVLLPLSLPVYESEPFGWTAVPGATGAAAGAGALSE